jgi:hypothetical protein
LNLWKNNVRANAEMFPLLLGLESEGGHQHISTHIGNHPEELQNTILFSLPFNTSVPLVRNLYPTSSA